MYNLKIVRFDSLLVHEYSCMCTVQLHGSYNLNTDSSVKHVIVTVLRIKYLEEI